MAEYESFPLWRSSLTGSINIDPASLPISPELAQELLDWADEFDATLNRDDPVASGFADETVAAAFYARGQLLARRVAAELGATHPVEYFDGTTGQSIAIS